MKGGEGEWTGGEEWGGGAVRRVKELSTLQCTTQGVVCVSCVAERCRALQVYVLRCRTRAKG